MKKLGNDIYKIQDVTPVIRQNIKSSRSTQVSFIRQQQKSFKILF